jgi:hypothetical protein
MLIFVGHWLGIVAKGGHEQSQKVVAEATRDEWRKAGS